MHISRSHARQALTALVLGLGVAGHAGPVRADAVSDQKKVFQERLGVKFDKKSNKCTLFTQADAERALHGPVVFLPNEVDPKICSWGLAKNSSVGVNVTRGDRAYWSVPDASDKMTSQIHHVKGVGEDAYTSYMNAGSGGVYDAQVLTSKGITDVVLSDKAGNAATALAIARAVMNR